MAAYAYKLLVCTTCMCDIYHIVQKFVFHSYCFSYKAYNQFCTCPIHQSFTSSNICTIRYGSNIMHHVIHHWFYYKSIMGEISAFLSWLVIHGSIDCIDSVIGVYTIYDGSCGALICMMSEMWHGRKQWIVPLLFCFFMLSNIFSCSLDYICTYVVNCTVTTADHDSLHHWQSLYGRQQITA